MFAVLTIGHAAIALSKLNWRDDPATARSIRAVLRRVAGDSPERLAAQALRSAGLLSRLGTDATLPAARRRSLAQGVIHCEDIARAATGQVDLPGTGGGAIMIYRDVDIYGVLLPGVLVVALGGLCMAFLFRRVLSRLGVSQRVWHPELFNIAVFILVFAALAQALP
ncbi:hypothetical protein ACVJBD_003220 [Rhizobium mongolense]